MNQILQESLKKYKFDKIEIIDKQNTTELY